MEDHVRQKAESKLADLLREADEVRSFIEMYDRLSAGADMPEPSPKAVSVTSRELISSRQEIIEASRAVLKASHPSPMLIGDIYDEITSNGIKIGGKSPKGNLSAKLSQPDDLIYVKDKGWYYQPTENEVDAPASEAKAGDARNVPGFLQLQPSPPRAQD